MEKSEYRRGRHSVTRLVCHLVFVAKYRRKVFDAAAIVWLQQHFGKVCDTMDCALLACDGETDHIHLLVEYPPKHSVSVLVNALKGTSSRLLRDARPDIATRYWKGVLWSPSYFAVSAGDAPLADIRQYVEEQRVREETRTDASPAVPPVLNGGISHGGPDDNFPACGISDECRHCAG